MLCETTAVHITVKVKTVFWLQSSWKWNKLKYDLYLSLYLHSFNIGQFLNIINSKYKLTLHISYGIYILLSSWIRPSFFPVHFDNIIIYLKVFPQKSHALGFCILKFVPIKLDLMNCLFRIWYEVLTYADCQMIISILCTYIYELHRFKVVHIYFAFIFAINFPPYSIVFSRLKWKLNHILKIFPRSWITIFNNYIWGQLSILLFFSFHVELFFLRHKNLHSFWKSCSVFDIECHDNAIASHEFQPEMIFGSAWLRQHFVNSALFGSFISQLHLFFLFDERKLQKILFL